MRPEKAAPSYELTDDEKIIVAILEKNKNKMPLTTLKEQADLSGKKWDKAMKALASYSLTKVITENEEKIVEFV